MIAVEEVVADEAERDAARESEGGAPVRAAVWASPPAERRTGAARFQYSALLPPYWRRPVPFPAMQLTGRLGALQEKQFRLLWAGQAVSAFGDGLYPVALAFAVVELTGSAADLGLVFMAVLIPRVVLVLGGGVWADRLPRQRVMLGADVLRCAMQALTAVFLFSGHDELWPLLVLSALYGAGDAFFQPAITGLVPETVQPSRIQQANALLGLTRNSFFLAGPVVAGIVVASAGPAWAFAVDAASFAVSAAFLALMRLPRGPRADRKPFVAELRAGWREVTSRTWVWTSIVYFAIWNLALAPMFVLGPFVAKESLGGASSWGLIVTCAGVGSLVGAAAALRLKPRRPLATGFLLFGLVRARAGAARRTGLDRGRRRRGRARLRR